MILLRFQKTGVHGRSDEMKYHKEVDEQNSTYFDEMFDQQIDPLYQNKTLKLFRTNSFFLWKINDTLETHLFWMKCFVKIN